MRLLIICLLFSTSVFAQSEGPSNVRYVWAKSGLTLRAEGKAGAEKIKVLPFGTAVTLTGKTGERIKVTALPSVTFNGPDGKVQSDAYVMDEEYAEVDIDGSKGFVFPGYLSALDPLADLPEESTMIQWLRAQDEEPRETDITARSYWSRGSVVHQYGNGMTVNDVYYEGGGASTIVIPGASINDGFLIMERWFGIQETIRRLKERKGEPDYGDEYLKILDDGRLDFQGDMSGTTIQRVGGMLIIHSAGGC